MASWERVAMFLAPLLAVATMAVGLRVGAAPAVTAAVVYGAPPSAQRSGLAWQVVTLRDDRGVRESVATARISVVARARGLSSRWNGGTDADGVAEAWLDLPGVAVGDAVALDVTSPDERWPLASGMAQWPSDRDRDVSSDPIFVRPSKQDGDLLVDVAVYGRRLAPGFSSSLWVRVLDRATREPVAGAVVDVEPEPGLDVRVLHATSSRAGYAEIEASAEIHVVALGLRVSSGEGVAHKAGAWYGAIPVAPGASFVAMPLAIPPSAAHTFDIVVPTVQPRIYAEVEDESGRAFAASLAVDRSHAEFAVPPLQPGTYWLVTSGDARGGSSLEGGSMARPFLVADPSSVDLSSVGPRLATLPTPLFERFVALDGLPGKRRADGSRHQRGLAIALGALGIAAALETLLLLRAAARSRRVVARLVDALSDQSAEIERRFSAANVMVGVLMGLLGFALLAALLTWKAG